ncbi:MAG: hypothetical protein OXC99_08805 [Chloroflexi bacterium]|nr:hypothetical protein [Chloroflexota bacterium]
MTSVLEAVSIESPNGGSANERRALHRRFQDRLTVDPSLARKVVSYQGNRQTPGFRWLKYKEGFSRKLVGDLIGEFRPEAVLDPFAGIGTAPLVAAGQGRAGTGIEILPLGIEVARGIAYAANGLDPDAFARMAKALIAHVEHGDDAPGEYGFRHVPITESAFPKETEPLLAKARRFVGSVDDWGMRTLLNLACMSVLEDVSYTRKDGQYLRWDFRSGRALRAHVNKGAILPFQSALESRLGQMLDDLQSLKAEYGKGTPRLLSGSCLEFLPTLPEGSFDMVITSPPYANRYDYTRTYALELAWLGFTHEDFSALRQRMLSATVENKSKRSWLESAYGPSDLLGHAINMFENEGALQEVLATLRGCVRELSNAHVIRLLEGYFLEMALVVAELGRVVKPGGTVVMVNDNVQYHGEEVPVDLILSDYAEQCGFTCKQIWVLPRGKGNSSQQMGRFGRRELRKCVYWWVRDND